MPSYPFFIWSIISTYDAAQGTNKEITTQGHCYQALLYIYLRNKGVKNEDFGDYLNFLTELAFVIFKNEGEELSSTQFQDFLDYYTGEFNLTVEIELLLSKIAQTNIFRSNSIGNYEFCYKYLYYYFTGKYLAENYEANVSEINELLDTLHYNDSAYISIFLSHHTNDDRLLSKLKIVADSLFSSFNEATLSKSELGFFDDQVQLIAEAVLPEANNLPIEERRKRIIEKEKLEELAQLEASRNPEQYDELNDDFSEVTKELRRSFKTVEVLGRIIKNRSGSIKKQELVEIFSFGMNVHLRAMGSFIEIISNPQSQIEVVDFISDIIDKKIKEDGIDPGSEDLKRLSKEIFWGANFTILFGFIHKIVHSLGSKKLLDISEKATATKETPAAHLVNQGILMWYGKTLRIKEIKDIIDGPEFSKTAERILKHQIAEHSKMHQIGFAKLQKLESNLGMSSKRLISERMKAQNR